MMKLKCITIEIDFQKRPAAFLSDFNALFVQELGGMLQNKVAETRGQSSINIVPWQAHHWKNLIESVAFFAAGKEETYLKQFEQKQQQVVWKFVPAKRSTWRRSSKNSEEAIPAACQSECGDR